MKTTLLSVLLLAGTGACGGRPHVIDAGTDFDAGAYEDASVGFDAGAGGWNVAAGLEAARATATTDPKCVKLNDFVWEIGTGAGHLGGGVVGTTYTPTSTMQIASATKWLFGAYVVERNKLNVGAVDVPAMTMRSGYVSFSYGTCTVLTTATVAKCFTALSNDKFTPGEVGQFDYNGGHFQKYAIDLGLGDKTNETLAAEFSAVLGTELPIAFDTPQLAAGAVMSLDGYAKFLRKIITGGLAIHEHLGENATCTLPSVCSTAVSSPAPYALHYSYGHWVEDEPRTGDGSFSSAGAYGFYPWIDATQTFYGIVARHVTGSSAYVESADCGRAMRWAFMAAAKR